MINNCPLPMKLQLFVKLQGSCGIPQCEDPMECTFSGFRQKFVEKFVLKGEKEMDEELLKQGEK